MKLCKICGKPIPRTKKTCEECEKSDQPINAFTENNEEEFDMEEDE